MVRSKLRTSGKSNSWFLRVLIALAVTISFSGVSSSFASSNCSSTFAWLEKADAWLKDGYLPEDIGDLYEFVQKGHLTSRQAIDLVEKQNMTEFVELYEVPGLSKKKLNSLVDAFGGTRVGEAIGPAILVPAPKAIGRRRDFVLLQKHESEIDETYQVLALHDPKTKKALTQIEYKISGARGQNMYIEWMGTSKNERGQGYSDFVFEQVLNDNPAVREIRSQVGALNAEIINSAVAGGLSPSEALKLMPVYKSHVRFGFTEVKITKGQVLYEIVAKKPGSILEKPPEGR